MVAALVSLLLAACGGEDGPTAPSITTQPASVTVKAGASASFSVTANGSGPLAYQWRRNGNNIVGATASSYPLSSVAASDNGAQFSVVVSNEAGTVTSTAATLTVNVAVAPTLTTPPVAQTVTEGAAATFSVSATGSDPLAYQWKRNGVDISGATAASYTTPATTVANDNGASYAVVVSNTAGSATSDAVTLTVTAAIVPASITTAPVAQSVTAGQTATFTVVAAGSAPLTYQWKRNGTDIAGATAASYTTPATAVAADNGALYSVVVNNAANTPVTSSAVALTVVTADVAVSITSQPSGVSVTAGQAASFTVVAAGTTPRYQWQRDGVAISGATSATYTLTSTAEADSGARFTVVVSNSVNSVTSAAATLTVGPAFIAPTVPAAQPADASVTAPATATFTVAPQGTAPFSYQWRKNGSNISGATAASYTTPATTVADSGALYSVVVTNGGGSATSRNATLTVASGVTSPTITTQPASSTATAGQTASFSVVAAGSGPLSYQWRKNGTNITGATAASYTTPAVATADNGALYTVVVSNTAGSVTSSAATLTVAALVAPSITVQPTNVSALNGASASFNVTATGTAPLAYQWRKNGTDITGATTATYTIPAVSFFEDGAAYSVVVSNAASTRATSNGATLTVTLPPSTVVGLAAGGEHSVAIRSDGTVFSWSGWGINNNLDLAGVGNVSSAVSVGATVRTKNVDGTPVLNALSVSAGTKHSAMVRTDKTVWTWGPGSINNPTGCPIGDGACETRYFPTQVKFDTGAPLTDAKQVSAGYYYMVALKEDGTVLAWGRNRVGQLGTGNLNEARNPVPVRAPAGGNLSGITAVSAGSEHALALKADGTVLAWGRNDYGQLGDGTPSAYSALPRTVETAPGVSLANVIAIAAGDAHSLALRSDGSVWAWGLNNQSALGDGTTLNRARAVQVRDSSGNPLSGITAIAAGWYHSVFLKSDGTVLTVGRNDVGQLGDNTNAANQTNAGLVRDAANNVFGSVTMIASTANHVLVKRSDGTVWAWGANNNFQIGDTTTVTRRNPVVVPAGS